MSNMKNFHLALPPEMYNELREGSEELQTSITEIARLAIADWIKQYKKNKIQQAIIQFAEEFGGTEADLDQDLEAAGLETLMQEEL